MEDVDALDGDDLPGAEVVVKGREKSLKSCQAKGGANEPSAFWSIWQPGAIPPYTTTVSAPYQIYHRHQFMSCQWTVHRLQSWNSTTVCTCNGDNCT